MAKNLGKFSIFQAKNVDFVVEYLDNDDEFRQGTEMAWRYSDALSIPLKPPGRGLPSFYSQVLRLDWGYS